MTKTAKAKNLQRRALNRIIRYVRTYEAYNGVTSVRVEQEPVANSDLISLQVRTRRSDCTPDSPRALVCRFYAHFLITRRGQITVCTVSHGLSSAKHHAKHVASMLRAKLQSSYVSRDELLEAVKAHALTNYNRGGWDEIVECYSDDELFDIIGKAKTTKGAIWNVARVVKLRHDYANEIRSTAF